MKKREKLVHIIIILLVITLFISIQKISRETLFFILDTFNIKIE